MDEKLKEQGIAYLSKMLNQLEKGTDFVVEQTPLVVQEYLTWSLWESVILSVFLIIPIFVGWVVYHYWWKAAKEWDLPSYSCGFDQGTRTVSRVVAIVINWAATIILSINSIMYVLQAVKIWLAPRVFLIEQLAQFVKQTRGG